MDERLSRAFAYVKQKKNVVWIVGSLLTLWCFLGSPSITSMIDAVRTVRTAHATPPTIKQVSGAGAVVVVTDTAYVGDRFTKHWKTEHTSGTFRAGQHLCASITSYTTSEQIFFDLPKGWVVEVSNTPENFQPDVSANGCKGGIAPFIAVSDPNSAPLVAEAKVRTYLKSHAKNFAMTFYAALILLAFWFRARQYMPRGPVNLEGTRKFYAGFAVGPGDFELSGKTIYRVNSDGRRVNLYSWRDKWHFDESCGEFMHVTKIIGDRVIFEPEPFGQRFVKHARTFFQRSLRSVVGVIAILFSCVAVGAAYGAFDPSQDGIAATGRLVLALGLGVFGLYRLLPVILNGHLRLIGPEPLQRAVPEFGMQQPHGTSTDDVTI